MRACLTCQCLDWCRKRGCIVTDDISREQYYELARRAQQSNAEIDALEKIFGEIKP